MKLFVWKNVLRDYTPGMAFAIARNKGEAIDQFVKAGITRYNIGELASTEPEVIPLRGIKPLARWVTGGG